MNKTIWLINAYAMPPEREQRIQTLKRAFYLNKRGYEVFIFGGSHLHNTNINLIKDNKKFLHNNYDGINFVHVKNKSYNNNSILRVYSLIEFYIRLFEVTKFIKKPDIISLYCSIPFSNVVYFLAKKLKAKLILEVVDLWPETFVSLKLMSKFNPFLKILYLSEKWIYSKAYKIVFSMEGGFQYIKDKKWDIDSGGPINLKKFFYINNGVDLTDFNSNRIQFNLEDDDLNNDDIFKVIYLGSIRLANGINLILDAAKLLADNKNVKFLIYGDGPERANIEKRILIEKIDNVILKQTWVELKYVPFILSKSSLNLLNYSNNSIFRYGGSQSKLFQYMASGKPICSNVKMGHCLISKFNLGIAKDFVNSKEYADAIYSFYLLPKEQYDEICFNALIASKEFDYIFLTNKYIDYCINDL